MELVSAHISGLTIFFIAYFGLIIWDLHVVSASLNHVERKEESGLSRSLFFSLLGEDA